jgi:ATP-dependent DNA helicase RecG
VRGTTIGKETLNDWLGQIKSATSPSIIPDIDAVQIDGKWVVIIHINEYPVKPVHTKGRYYKRLASSNHQLGLSEITDLYLQSLQMSWDAHEAHGESLDTLCVDKIEKFIAQVNESGRFTLDPSPLLALQKLKYVTAGQPTLAAVLLFATEPPRHHIHIGRFKTPSMIIDDRQITDTLFEAVEQAMKFIISHVSVAFSFDGSLQRKERFAYPLPALREILLNAVVHRDYSNTSDIQIKIFDDYLTIYSPGSLYGGLKIEDLSSDTYQSHARNKLIAEAFYLTNNIEKYGSGFIRIRQELKEYPELAFSIEEVSGGILVTFRQQNQADEGLRTLMQSIQQSPGIQAKQLKIELDRPSKTIERQVKILVEKELVERRGSRKTGGYYVVN